ncbi:hypothetical protein BDN67DRAFT_1016652 [Paxillus ammoniavirescens]|nr:hypothetical protein BDN67DRAFT_1016652 [Paxillus ammoniavirescens]
MASTTDNKSGEGQQHQWINSALADVLKLIEKLPHSLPIGTPDGSIATHFSNFEIDADEGPYFTVNQAWERTFQKAGESAITRGQYGIKVVHDFLVHFLQIPGIEANGGLNLMLGRVHQLMDMLKKVSVAAKAVDSSLKIKLNMGGNAITASNKQKRLWEEVNDENDADYVPPQREPLSPNITDDGSDDAIQAPGNVVYRGNPDTARQW